MGRLYPHHTNDEPASNLLERIKTQKTQIEEQGKSKKSRTQFARKRPDSSRCDIPEQWEWARLGEIIQLISGYHLKPQEYSNDYSTGCLPYITGTADFGEVSPKPTRFALSAKAVAERGDILITCKGSGVGRLNLCSEPVAISRQLMAIRPILVDCRWLFYVLAKLREEIRNRVVGIAIPGILRDDILESWVALPPLVEQTRIADHIEQLLALSENLKERLDVMANTKRSLADVVMTKSVS